MQRYCDLILMSNRKHILLIRRDNFPDIPGAGEWSVIGGQIQSGETPETAILRETKEEIGLHIISPIPAGVVDDQWDGGRVRHFIFISHVADPITVVLHEGKEYGWFTPEDIDRMAPDLVPWFAKVYLPYIIERT